MYEQTWRAKEEEAWLLQPFSALMERLIDDVIRSVLKPREEAR